MKSPFTSPKKGSTKQSSEENASTRIAAQNTNIEAPEPDSTNDGIVRDIAYYKAQVKTEKAGKRKLFHSLVKLAEELKKIRAQTDPLQEQANYENQTWYTGGLWRAPQLLPMASQPTQSSSVVENQRTRLREAVSLSDLFFNLVTVTAFTRVGVAITNTGKVSAASLMYFAVFWSIWSKEASYSSRFDTTDLSAKAEALVTCLAVLFASMSASQPMDSSGGIMIMAAFCSSLHCALMARVFWWHRSAETNTVEYHVRQYGLYHTAMNFIEATTWVLGAILVPVRYRWAVFAIGVLVAQRIPRAFLANDFHAACTKRGVVFILLLGFMLQSVVVVAADFFDYATPDWEQYSFIGASCLLLFCIKLLYVDDSATMATDHALLVNRTAALFFNLGQFALLFSTTIMGSGLTLLTHSYLAAAAALPGEAKSLVCRGFAAVLISTSFIKSMHLKRVPVSSPHKFLFIAAHVIQTIATLAIATVCVCMGDGGYLQVLMNDDVRLMWILSGFAVFLVVLGWLDEGLELALRDDDEGSEYLVNPFGFWWCLKPEVGMDEIMAEEHHSKADPNTPGSSRPSELSPLLVGESVANMRTSATGTRALQHIA